jgi:hypothetical protein
MYQNIKKELKNGERIIKNIYANISKFYRYSFAYFLSHTYISHFFYNYSLLSTIDIYIIS